MISLLEEMIMSKFLFLMKGVGIVLPIISLILWFRVIFTCLREDWAEGWKLDIYHVVMY